VRLYFSVILVLLLSLKSSAQEETVVTGKVYEKGKQEVLPFVTLHFKGTQIGTTTDFDGNFSIKTTKATDTLIVSFIGYATRKIHIRKGATQHLSIELTTQTTNLKEVVIKPGVNPAIRIIRNAQRNREKNSMDNLVAVEYNSYSKQDVSMNNISESMKNQKMFAPIKSLFDTVHQMKNEDGKYILPVLISETYSKYYQQKNPSLTKDVIEANTVKGFGVEKNSYITDIIGSSVNQFNFNRNWIRYLGKDFMSPIADNSMDYYIYELQDSTFIDGHKCYEIRLYLRRDQDLGFIGKMWIADTSFAIKRIHVELAKSANINLIDRFRIQQELTKTEQGSWVPVKTRTIVDVAQLTKNTTGFVVKMYTSNSNIIINQPHPSEFFDVPIERLDNSEDKDTSFWTAVRPEVFSSTESAMTNMIDSVKKLPAVKTYIDIFRLVLEGHYRVGSIDYGPYLLFLGYNEVEHLRIRFGFRTNRFFSNKWFLRSYLAYGVKDEKFKYGINVDRILSQRKWTTIGVGVKSDYDILGVTDASSANMMGRTGGGNLFTTLSFASPGTRMNRTLDFRLIAYTQPKRDWSYRLSLANTYFEPVGQFKYAHRHNPNIPKPDTATNLGKHFSTTSITADIRFAYKELLISRGVDRIRINRARLPVLTLSYTHGFKGIFHSDFTYDKIQLSIEQHVTTGKYGNADFRIMCGRIFGTLPYPLLDVARGNSTILYSDYNYGLMNLYEFVADQYSHFTWVQHFEGFFTNRIPGLRKLNLRNYGFAKMCYGHLSHANKKVIPSTDEVGQALSPVYEFKNVPYAEVGFGFENIFKLFQVGVVRRLTYLDNNQVRKWGATVGVILAF